jgi:hypothetical protein
MTEDRILLEVGDDEYLFNDGWKDWSPLLREVLSGDHERDIIEEEPERWRFERS